MLHGNLSGLAPSQIKALERIYRRKIPAENAISGDLARYLTERSHELGRQLGILVDRRGEIKYVIVGDDREIVIPDISHFPRGRSGLRGLRCIHTHLKEEPLSQDDLTDLALLRLDLMMAIGVGDEGLPGRVHYAHLLPHGNEDAVEVVEAPSVYALELPFEAFLASLESELERKAAETIDLSDTRERAILISVSGAPRREMEDSLDELAELARTADVVVLERIMQRTRRINPKYLMGAGKIREVVIEALQRHATMLIFDQELSPAQVRALSAVTEMKIVDRTQLILDIFAQRAPSLEGKLQVELAQLEHLSTRLVRGWTHLERQKGGIGLRGPGETQLETDRRLLGRRIKHLKGRLGRVERQRDVSRRERRRAETPTVALVGYTNAGKTTLFNALTEAGLETRDQLFATLDPTVRRLPLGPRDHALVADTVGFVRDLPHELVAAFKSTLTETRDAALLLHVIDASDPHHEDRLRQVEAVLEEIGASEVDCIRVYNKVDRLSEERRRELEAPGNAKIWVSAKSGLNLDRLVETIRRRVAGPCVARKLELGPEESRIRAKLFDWHAVRREQAHETGGWTIDVELPASRWRELCRAEGLSEDRLQQET